MIQRRLLITGTVQGVGFRMSALRAAKKFPDLHGYVRNLADGRVEAVFSGKEDEVLFMTAWCKKGPPGAQVKKLEVAEELADATLPLFEVRQS